MWGKKYFNQSQNTQRCILCLGISISLVTSNGLNKKIQNSKIKIIPNSQTLKIIMTKLEATFIPALFSSNQSLSDWYTPNGSILDPS